MGAHLIGALSVWGFVLPSEMCELTQGLRRVQRELFEMRLDIAVDTPVQAEPPAVTLPSDESAAPAVAAAAPAPQPVMKPRAPDLPSPAPPPPPEPLRERAQRTVSAAADMVAEAAKMLTRDDDPPEAVAVATGDSDALLSGEVAGAGKGTAATFRPTAALQGKAGGVGRSTKPDASLGPDRSRGAGVIGGFTDACDFPAEADIARIDHAVVVVRVRIRPNGTAEEVTVLSDPGHGFGRAAHRCAKQSRYYPARDRSGTSVAAEAVVNVRFTR